MFADQGHVCDESRPRLAHEDAGSVDVQRISWEDYLLTHMWTGATKQFASSIQFGKLRRLLEFRSQSLGEM